MSDVSTVWVLDTSAIIDLKTKVPAKKLWEVLKHLEQLIDEGTIVFCREVARETKDVAHPDAPGTWVHGVESLVKHAFDPDEEVLQEVLSIVPDVIDPSKPIDGDPYVLAQAEQLRRAGMDPIVVTQERTDRPSKIAMTTACDRLGLAHEDLEEFLESVT